MINVKDVQIGDTLVFKVTVVDNKSIFDKKYIDAVHENGQMWSVDPTLAVEHIKVPRVPKVGSNVNRKFASITGKMSITGAVGSILGISGKYAWVQWYSAVSDTITRTTEHIDNLVVID